MGINPHPRKSAGIAIMIPPRGEPQWTVDGQSQPRLVEKQCAKCKWRVYCAQYDSELVCTVTRGTTGGDPVALQPRQPPREAKRLRTRTPKNAGCLSRGVACLA